MQLSIAYHIMQTSRIHCALKLQQYSERPTLYFGQMSIPNVTDCRYLGITISVKNCDLGLKRQKRRFYANTNMLLRKFVKCSPDVKCYLLKHIVVTCTVHHSGTILLKLQ